MYVCTPVHAWVRRVPSALKERKTLTRKCIGLDTDSDIVRIQAAKRGAGHGAHQSSTHSGLQSTILRHV